MGISVSKGEEYDKKMVSDHRVMLSSITFLNFATLLVHCNDSLFWYRSIRFPSLSSS